jgi:hypothetical protein
MHRAQIRTAPASRGHGGSALRVVLATSSEVRASGDASH